MMVRQWIKNALNRRLRFALINTAKDDALGFIGATDLLAGEHDPSLVEAMRCGGRRFDDRLAIIYGVANRFAHEYGLNKTETLVLVSRLLEPEAALASERGLIKSKFGG